VNENNTGHVTEGDLSPAASFSSPERQGDVPQDILAVLPDPRDDIFYDPLLAPSPFLATSTALDTGLFRYQDSHPVNRDTFSGLFSL